MGVCAMKKNARCTARVTLEICLRGGLEIYSGGLKIYSGLYMNKSKTQDLRIETPRYRLPRDYLSILSNWDRDRGFQLIEIREQPSW